MITDEDYKKYIGIHTLNIRKLAINKGDKRYE